jgi:exopolysaccharide biosynthesis predicted pyruvyltransferase EpsI
MNALRRLFEQYMSRKFVFVEPGGNYGDYLIYRGAEKLADQIGLRYHSIPFNEYMFTQVDHEKVIYIHGGGTYNPWWSGTSMWALLKSVQFHKGILIQGPSTVHREKNFLEGGVARYLKDTNTEKIYFFTRERASYEALREVLPSHVELGLDHDTALHLTCDDLPSATADLSSRTFYAIRNDKESRRVADHSKQLRLWFDPVPSSQSFDEWIQHHACVGEVITNRLHSAIVSTILGKDTTLLPNSYHKNRSVYEFSLAQRGVRWQTEVANITIDHVLSGLLPDRLKRTSLVNRGVSKVLHYMNGLPASTSG